MHYQQEYSIYGPVPLHRCGYIGVSYTCSKVV